MSKIVHLINLIFPLILKRPLILAFHHIKKDNGSLSDQRIGVIDPKLFEKVLTFLKKRRYRFVSLNELVSIVQKGKKEKVAVVTFDDGYKDLYKNAFTFLRKNKIPFTLFIITSTVEAKKLLWLHKLYISLDEQTENKVHKIVRKYKLNGMPIFTNFPNDIVMYKDKNTIREITNELAKSAGINQSKEEQISAELYLKKSEIMEMVKSGLKIELHANEHFPLVNLSKEETEEEIERSIEFLKNEFNIEPKFWCLPFGMKNKYVRGISHKNNLNGTICGPSNLVLPDVDFNNIPRIEFSNNLDNFHTKLFKSYLKALLKQMRIKYKKAKY